MAVLAPIRLDHVKRTLRGIVQDAVDDSVAASSVVWAEQGIPRQPRPLVALSLVDGPFSDATTKEERRERLEVTSVDVSVLSAVSGSLYRTRVNGYPFEVVADGASTVTTLRDSFIALINNTATPTTKQTEPVSAAAGVGPGDFTIMPTSPGGIYVVETAPVGLMSATTNVDNTALTTHLIGRERMLFQVDVFTRGGVAIELSSRMLARRITKAFDLESTIARIANARVPLRIEGTIQDTTGLENADGAVFESRCTFQVVAFASSRIAESTVPIESVEITTVVDGNQDTFTVTAP